MRASSDSLLPFSIQPKTPIQKILAVHDGYLRMRGRRQFVEHAVAILGGIVILLSVVPLDSPPVLGRFLLFAWLALVVMCVLLGASEVLLRRRRERLLHKLNR